MASWVASSWTLDATPRQTDCKFEDSALVDTVDRLTSASLSRGVPHDLA